MSTEEEMPEKERKREREEQTEEPQDLFTEIEEKLLAEGPYNDQTIVETENIDIVQSSPPEERSERIKDDQNEQNREDYAQREKDQEEITEREPNLVAKVEEGFNDQVVIYEEENEYAPFQQEQIKGNNEKVQEKADTTLAPEELRAQIQEEGDTHKGVEIERRGESLEKFETAVATQKKYATQKIVWENDTQKKRVAETPIREKLDLEREETEKDTLLSELQAFIKTRDNFPNILFEYWLTQRGKIE